MTIPPWDGKERLNILLIGADQRPSEGTFNTDTLIVVSIDPVTKQVAMFSLPRDTSDVPIPPGPARNVFGSVYRGKINAWWTNDPPPHRSVPGHGQERDASATTGSRRSSATSTASTSSTSSRSTSTASRRSST